MATLGTIDGNAIAIFVDDNLVACATSASLDLSTSMATATCKDNGGAEQVKPAQNSWTMAIDANMAFDSSYGWSDLIAAWLAKSEITVMFTTYVNPGSELPVVGDENYSGTAYIESLSANAPLNEVTTYNCSFKGSGPLAIGTNA